MKRWGAIAITGLLLALALAGCGDQGGAGTGGPAVNAPAPGGSQAGGPAGGLNTVLDATPVGPQGAGDGVGALTSYVLGIESQVEIVKPTPGLESSTIIEKQVQAQPAPGVYHLTVTDKSGPASEQIEMIVSGAAGYVYSAEQKKWLQVPIEGNQGVDPSAGRLLDPAALVRSVPSGLLGQSTLVSAHERIEGLDTSHYRLTGADLAQWAAGQNPAGSEALSGQADFWLANGAGYLKQYQFQAVVREPGGVEKRHTARLLLSGENKPLAIATPPADQVIPMISADETPPAQPTVAPGLAQRDAQAALGQLPTPPQGQVAAAASLSPALQATVENYRTGIAAQNVYVSTGTPEEILAHYQRELVSRGWTLVMAAPAKGPDLPTLAGYRKGEMNLQLVILPADDGKRVVLVQIPG